METPKEALAGHRERFLVVMSCEIVQRWAEGYQKEKGMWDTLGRGYARGLKQGPRGYLWAIGRACVTRFPQKANQQMGRIGRRSQATKGSEAGTSYW